MFTGKLCRDYRCSAKLSLGTPLTTVKLSLETVFVPKCNLGTSGTDLRKTFRNRCTEGTTMTQASAPMSPAIKVITGLVLAMTAALLLAG